MNCHINLYIVNKATEGDVISPDYRPNRVNENSMGPKIEP